MTAINTEKAARIRAWRKRTGYDAKTYAANPLKALVRNAKSRAKKAGLPFDITEHDLTIPTHCPILGIELKRGIGKRVLPSSPSIDRIVPYLGYTKGNVAIVSHKANIMKNDATPDMLHNFADWVKANVSLN